MKDETDELVCVCLFLGFGVTSCCRPRVYSVCVCVSECVCAIARHFKHLSTVSFLLLNLGLCFQAQEQLVPPTKGMFLQEILKNFKKWDNTFPALSLMIS